MEYEQNPIGVWLMQLDGGDVALFMGLKFAGTVLVLGYLSMIYRKHENFAWAVMTPLFIFQSFLLLYLQTDIYKIFQ
tara:strand:- start:1756 stop:1986 length:231 start_codon:yes stop_codon:yes gene_type:complete